MLAFNFMMCFLEKNYETSCSKTEMEETFGGTEFEDCVK